MAGIALQKARRPSLARFTTRESDFDHVVDPFWAEDL
jgi:hypothetical protein